MPQQPVPMTLVMQRGPHLNRSFPVDKDQLVIGRDASVDIVIDNREVSRHHARLSRRGNQWIIEDIGSSNGTFVNGKRISGPVVLAPGSQVGLGPDVILGAQSTAPAHAAAASQSRGGVGGLGWGIVGAVAVLVAILLIGGGAAAYFLLLNPPTISLPSLELSGMAAPSEGPVVTLNEPAAGSRVGSGATLLVFATARDAQKVTRLDLWINDTLVTQQASPAPEGVTPLSLVYQWTPTEAGVHYVLVRAYDSTGVTGESPLVAVTVSGDSAQPLETLHMVQPGDTVDSLAAQMGVSAADVRAANPSVGADVAPGQMVVLPAPKAGGASQPGAAPGSAPAPPPAKPGGAAGAAGAGPAVLGPPPPPPANAALTAPTLIGLQAADCKVTVAWQDNGEGEDGFGVLRASLGQPGFQLLKPMVGKLEGTGKQQQFIDTVPGPGSYVYTVVAGTAAGAQARSNPHTIVVPPTAGCVEPPSYKQVVFQPLQVQAGKYNSLDMYFDVGNHIYRRVPAKGHLSPGDWSGSQQTVLAPAYLKPGDPLVLTVTGEGRAGKVSEALGSFSRSFAVTELTADRQWQDQVAATGFDVTYRLWMESVIWGQSTNKQMPPPSNLRLATTAAELDVVPGCAPAKCNPKASRSLVWDWAGDPALVDGYLLLRSYKCGGKETHSTDVVVRQSVKGRIMPAGSEPAGCAASYQVSAFGPAGVSPPSQTLEVAAAVQPAANVAVAFDKFGVNGVLSGSGTVQVAFQANDQLVKSANVMLPSMSAQPGDQILEMSRQFLDGRAPNNQVVLGLVAGDSLQIGFIAQVGDSSCTAQQIVSLKPGETWAQYEGRDVTLKSSDGKCEAQVRIGQSSQPLSADESKPNADIGVMDIVFVGEGAYAVLKNVGPDPLPHHHLQVVARWRLRREVAGSSLGELVDERLESTQTVLWPANADQLVLKVAEPNSPRRFLDGSSAGDLVQYLSVDGKPVDFDGGVGSMSSSYMKLPMGYGCLNDEDCRSGHCAAGKKCAYRNGVGEAGDYCHHDEQCGSGLCICPDGWEGGSGLCKGWEQFTLFGPNGTCSAQFEDGYNCTDDKDCISGNCADDKLCAPEDGTGIVGDYCHHDNHCQTGLCLCPDGWEGGSGFCKGWENFSADGSHGTCSEALVDGATCTEDKDCDSGYCADGEKCAPKDGTGSEGDYCHHDNQCYSGSCDCPGDDVRVMGAKSFCPDWKSFTSTIHGVCRAFALNGDSCLRDEQCDSGYCADGKKCAPKDGTGQVGDYCHHDNQCASGMCDCPGDDIRVMGAKTFCSDWEAFTANFHGVCRSLNANGDGCTRDEQCESGYCADGKKCAPEDGTGGEGDYCHHNNHCQTRVCDCPDGTDWLGFCNGWKDFTATDHATCQVY